MASTVTVKKDLPNLGRLVKKLEKSHMTRMRAKVARSGVVVGRAALKRVGVDPATGVPWKPRKRDAPWPVLNRTGAMLKARALRYKKKSEREVLVFFTAKKSFRDGPGGVRFWVHVKGHSKRRLFARPHIGFSDGDMAAIQRAAMAAVEESMRQTSG